MLNRGNESAISSSGVLVREQTSIALSVQANVKKPLGIWKTVRLGWFEDYRDDISATLTASSRTHTALYIHTAVGDCEAVKKRQILRAISVSDFSRREAAAVGADEETVGAKMREAGIMLISTVLTCAVIGNAYYQRKQFYPTVVHITKSNPSMTVSFVFSWHLWGRGRQAPASGSYIHVCCFVSRWSTRKDSSLRSW